MKSILQAKGEVMNITEFIVEKIIDPTGLIEGDRYEFRLYAMLDEEDDLYTENGIGIRTILAVEGEEVRLAMAHFFDRSTEDVHNFELEEEELAELLQFCGAHYTEAF